MKKLKLNLLTLGVVAIVLSSCGGLNKMVDKSSTVQYSVNPSPLETHGGQVEVTIKTVFPEKYFNKKATVVATPVLKYEGGEAKYEGTTLQGEKVEANNKVIPYAGGDYSYSGKIAYTPEMLKSELVMSMSASIKDKDPIEIPGIKIADGVIATSTLVKVDPKAILQGDKFQRSTSEAYNAEILYLINKADIRNTELKKADLKAMQDKIKTAKTNEKTQIKGASISSYASPDGEYDLNDKLAGKRSDAAESYMKKTLKTLKIEGSDDSFLSTLKTAEDWDGFKKLMEASDIQDKELILRVLSMYSDPAVREKEIKNISAAFEEIKVKILPQLRRSQMAINVEKMGYSDEELAALVKSNPDTLNVEELLYAATLTEDLDEKLTIYQKAAEKYPDCYRAKNNIGYIQMLKGNTAEAKAAFTEAQAINDDDIVKNNLGAVALLEGDAVTAESLLTSATGAGDAASYNLGIIKIQQADYATAVNYFGATPSFNAALAQLLNGDPNKALATLDEMGEVDDAMVYYLKAVAGARTSNEEVVLNGLRSAIEKDSALKEYAKKDLEFRNYAAGEAFTAILQ